MINDRYVYVKRDRRMIPFFVVFDEIRQRIKTLFAMMFFGIFHFYNNELY